MYTVVNVRAPKAPALEKDGKNDYWQAKITFSDPALLRHHLWNKREKRFLANKNGPFPGCGLSKHQLWRYIQKNYFQQKKHLFKSWPLLTTSSGRTSTSRFFGSESHFPNQFSSPIIDFSSQKQVNQAICWAYM